MKTKSLLLLAGLAVLTTTSSRAAHDQTLDDVVVLPVYTIEAPRYNRVEKQINASLDEARQWAKTPLMVPPEFTTLQALDAAESRIAMAVRQEDAVRIAGL